MKQSGTVTAALNLGFALFCSSFVLYLFSLSVSLKPKAWLFNRDGPSFAIKCDPPNVDKEKSFHTHRTALIVSRRAMPIGINFFLYQSVASFLCVNSRWARKQANESTFFHQLSTLHVCLTWWEPQVLELRAPDLTGCQGLTSWLFLLHSQDESLLSLSANVSLKATFASRDQTNYSLYQGSRPFHFLLLFHLLLPAYLSVWSPPPTLTRLRRQIDEATTVKRGLESWEYQVKRK